MTDTAEVRRIARRARRLGWTAQELAAQNDSQWQRFRICAECEDATDSELAEMIDVLSGWEASEAQFGSQDLDVPRA